MRLSPYVIAVLCDWHPARLASCAIAVRLLAPHRSHGSPSLSPWFSHGNASVLPRGRNVAHSIALLYSNCRRTKPQPLQEAAESNGEANDPVPFGITNPITITEYPSSSLLSSLGFGPPAHASHMPAGRICYAVATTYCAALRGVRRPWMRPQPFVRQSQSATKHAKPNPCKSTSTTYANRRVEPMQIDE